MGGLTESVGLWMVGRLSCECCGKKAIHTFPEEAPMREIMKCPDCGARCTKLVLMTDKGLEDEDGLREIPAFMRKRHRRG